MLEAGLRPMPTLFEGDLPRALHEDGGWSVPDTAHRFADYARIVADALGDRVARWILIDHPQAFLIADSVDTRSFLPASHVVNLAVGRGFRAVKAVCPDARMGTAVRLAACEAATGSARDAAAAERSHRFENAWFLDPILRGLYPNAFLGTIPYDLMRVRDGDLETTRVPLDFVGLGHLDTGELPCEGEPFRQEVPTPEAVEQTVHLVTQTDQRMLERLFPFPWDQTHHTHPLS